MKDLTIRDLIDGLGVRLERRGELLYVHFDDDGEPPEVWVELPAGVPRQGLEILEFDGAVFVAPPKIQS